MSVFLSSPFFSFLLRNPDQRESTLQKIVVGCFFISYVVVADAAVLVVVAAVVGIDVVVDGGGDDFLTPTTTIISPQHLPPAERGHRRRGFTRQLHSDKHFENGGIL